MAKKVSKKRATKKRATKAVAKKAIKKATKKASKVPFSMQIIERVGRKVKGIDLNLASESETLADVTEWIPTGFAGLDEIFGGGWAVGRVSEVFGAEGSGKSAIAHYAAKTVADMGGTVVYVDFEHSLERRILRQLGIPDDALVHVEPDHVEQGWDVVFQVLETLIEDPPDVPTLIVWDSVGASRPRAEVDADSFEDVQPAAHARAISKGVGRLFKLVAKARAAIILINQETTDMGGGGPRGGFGGPSYNTTGGKRAKYTFSLRARVARVSTIKTHGTSGTACGYLIAVTTKKNKTAPPHQQARFYLDFKHGPSPLLTMWHVLKDANRIRSAGGGKYTGPWADGEKFGKADAFLAFLEEHPELAEAARESYLEIVRAGGAKALLQIESGEVEED